MVFKYLVRVEGKGYKRGLRGKRRLTFLHGLLTGWQVRPCIFLWPPMAGQDQAKDVLESKGEVLDSQTWRVSTWWLSYTQLCQVLRLWFSFPYREMEHDWSRDLHCGIAGMVQKVHELSAMLHTNTAQVPSSWGNASQCYVNFWSCIITRGVKSTWKEHLFLKGFVLLVLVEFTLLYRHVFVMHSA